MKLSSENQIVLNLEKRSCLLLLQIAGMAMAIEPKLMIINQVIPLKTDSMFFPYPQW
jgi:hypothetical protein